MRHYLPVILLLGGLCLLPATPSHAAITCVFTNPLIGAGQDPSVVQHDGYYYLVQSSASGLSIAKSPTLTGLATAEPVFVYSPPRGQPYSYDLWAPELVYLDGAWYIYVAATERPGANYTHRMYVLQADTTDPQGSWTMKGKVYDPTTDKWAIDGTVFEYEGQLYMVWSGWPGDQGDFPQNLYIAPMSDPLTLSGPRHLLSEPDQPWERSVAAIQEGPEAFIHNGTLSIVYSADASWSRAYKLGMLVLTGDDPLDAASWTKVGPVFSGYADETGNAYGPGHNSTPVLSPDGSESWLFYHAKTRPGDGWEDRAIFAQPFTWNEDGTPNFGRPVPAGATIPLPAGELCGLVAADAGILAASLEAPAGGVFELEESFIDTGMNWLDTLGSFTVAAEVQLADPGTPAPILSQDGGISSNFALEYTGEGFAFTLFAPFGNMSIRAAAPLTPAADQWVHLTGVWDAQTRQAALYVDGELKATAALDSAWEPWPARGNTILGALRQGGKRSGTFSGTIRHVQLYSGMLDAAEVRALVDSLR